jgi:hypothetical protein
MNSVKIELKQVSSEIYEIKNGFLYASVINVGTQSIFLSLENPNTANIDKIELKAGIVYDFVFLGKSYPKIFVDARNGTSEVISHF